MILSLRCCNAQSSSPVWNIQIQRYTRTRDRRNHPSSCRSWTIHVSNRRTQTQYTMSKTPSKPSTFAIRSTGTIRVRVKDRSRSTPTPNTKLRRYPMTPSRASTIWHARRSPTHRQGTNLEHRNITGTWTSSFIKRYNPCPTRHATMDRQV